MNTTMEPVKNNVIFQFKEDTTNTKFLNSSHSGIIIAATDTNQAGHARWGKVTHIGPEVYDVLVGQYILIENGMWTTAFTFEGERYWKTDEDKIMCISDTPSTTY